MYYNYQYGGLLQEKTVIILYCRKIKIEAHFTFCFIWLFSYYFLFYFFSEQTRYRTTYACEGSTLNMECDPGHVINLIRANYGRFSITICNEHGNTEWSVNCMSRRSHRVLHDKYVLLCNWTNFFLNFLSFKQNIFIQ